MSFGAAASAHRGRRPAPDALCPCGRRAFAACCGPVLDGVPAETPEDLMRSRYTAFALADARHLADTWWPATRPDDVSVDDGTSWLGLEVLRSETTPDGRTGRVAFRARWRDTATGESRLLEEDSRFLRRAGRWYYADAL
ncbi:YchJ family protein [Microbacterium oleivorans]|uniref:YchJ family protein n=1 Tax=Microbacterium oleivorans TaxID=273677 RepID=UPI00204161DA|nr:YchJ family metal-binding protein [Microbacterium oleivorans]MCM3696432.1 YchJ family metal-binding protein [Microbacterium oleivorans]